MPDPASPSVSVFRRFRIAGLFVAATLAVLLVQSLTGVWTSDVGADPDEPAHAVTSLMVRDYLASGLGQSPLAFAQHYYEDFPKVALGHYPPVYYALAGVVLLPWPQPQILLILQAVLIGLLAVQVYWTGRRILRESSALAAAVMSAAFPVTLKLSQLIMADILLACLCLLAVEIWARYMEKPRASLGLLFGVTAAAAILTKGSGLALALVPAVSVWLMGRWDLLKKPSFWLAGVSVAVLAGPWMVYSSKITQEGMVSTGLFDFAFEGVKYYATTLSTTFGFMTVMVAVPGLAVWLGLTQVKMCPDVRRSALLGMLVGTALIMLLVPTGYSSRYFMPVVPAVALLAVSFFEYTLSRTPLYRVGIASLVLLTLLQVPNLLVKNVKGYGQAVLPALEAKPAGKTTHWLVCADPRGEGAVIASAAFALPTRVPSSLRVHRGSKELATTDWLGRGYQAAFTTPEALLAYLAETDISRVFVDITPPDGEVSAHESLLLKTLRGHPEQWLLDRTEATIRPFQSVPGQLEVYVRRP